MDTVNLGRVGFVMQGEHDIEKEYTRLDCVSKDGVSYIARQRVPAWTPLTDSDYWQLLIDGGKVVSMAQNMVLVQDEQPTNEHNVLWIKENPDEIEVPTKEAFEDLKRRVAVLEALVASN